MAKKVQHAVVSYKCGERHAADQVVTLNCAVWAANNVLDDPNLWMYFRTNKNMMRKP